jgi:hypothetical protein
VVVQIKTGTSEVTIGCNLMAPSARKQALTTTIFSHSAQHLVTGDSFDHASLEDTNGAKVR